MEKLRTTTNSFSQVSEYGDQNSNSQKLVLQGCYLAWVRPHAIHFELLTGSEVTDQMCNHKPVKETLAPRSESVAILALQELFFSSGR